MVSDITFGENLKRLRKRARLTQNDVAEALNISRQSVSKWEKDIALPQISFISPLTKILNCTLEELLGSLK